MDSRTVAEVFRQIQQGDDIPVPVSLFKGISKANATRRMPGFPYSIIENLWHAVFWQNIWLDRLQGRKSKSFLDDWQSPHQDEFGSLIKQFLKNQEIVRKSTTGASFKHKMKSDEIAIKLLIGFAIHDTYHLGQINLMKRVIRALNRK